MLWEPSDGRKLPPLGSPFLFLCLGHGHGRYSGSVTVASGQHARSFSCQKLERGEGLWEEVAEPWGEKETRKQLFALQNGHGQMPPSEHLAQPYWCMLTLIAYYTRSHPSRWPDGLRPPVSGPGFRLHCLSTDPEIRPKISANSKCQ